jgi:hypothetical protein
VPFCLGRESDNVDLRETISVQSVLEIYDLVYRFVDSRNERLGEVVSRLAVYTNRD